MRSQRFGVEKIMPDAKYKLVDAVNTSKYSREGREPTWYMARVAEARNAVQRKEGRKEHDMSSWGNLQELPSINTQGISRCSVTGIFKDDQASGKRSLRSSLYIMDIKSLSYYATNIFLRRAEMTCLTTKFCSNVSQLSSEAQLGADFQCVLGKFSWVTRETRSQSRSLEKGRDRWKRPSQYC